MGGNLDELIEIATGFIPAGETVKAAATVIYGGKVNVSQTVTGVAMAGSTSQVAVGEAIAVRYGEHHGVEFPSAKQMALVLTDVRLLCWSLGGLKAKPKAFLGEVPVAAINAVDVESRRGGSRVTIRLETGWEVHLDVNHDDDGAFAGALAAAAQAGSSPAPPPATDAAPATDVAAEAPAAEEPAASPGSSGPLESF